MNIESQVCSLEYAKRLKELGVRPSGLFSWQIDFSGQPFLNLSFAGSIDCDDIGAFTVAELIQILPGWIDGHFLKITKASSIHVRYWSVSSCIPVAEHEEIEGDNLADVLAQLLIYLLDNGLISNE